MSSENNRTNFIKNIIKDDLASGKHDSIITRFPPEPNGYLPYDRFYACSDHGDRTKT